MKTIDTVELVKACLIIALLGAFMVVAVYTGRPEPVRPTIMIMRESTVKDYLTGGDALLVEYFVGGVSTHAIFRPDQMHEYQALIDHLEDTGRLTYAIKR
jgi:hypothetical protein